MPIGIVTLLAASRILPESHSEDRSRSYDLPGAITATLGLVLLVDAMVGTTTYGWGATRTIVELVGSALLLGIFLVIEGRFAAHPLVPLRIFHSRTLSGANAVAALLGLALFGVFYLLSLYMQQVLGYSPLTAAVAYLLFSDLLVVTAAGAPVLIGRIGARWLPILRMLIAAAGAVVAFLTIATSIGRRIEPVRRTVPEVSSPTQGAPPSPEASVRPVSALAVCAQYSPIARHQFVTEEASRPLGES